MEEKSNVAGEHCNGNLGPDRYFDGIKGFVTRSITSGEESESVVLGGLVAVLHLFEEGVTGLPFSIVWWPTGDKGEEKIETAVVIRGIGDQAFGNLARHFDTLRLIEETQGLQ